MRKYLFAITPGLLGVALSIPSRALASELPPATTITANPLDLVSGIVNFQLEHAIAYRASAYVGVNFLVISPVWDHSRGSGYFAVGPEAGVRFFLIGTAPEGLFIGPFGTIDYVSASDHSTAGFSAGGMAGVTVIAFDVLDLSLGAGLEYRGLGITVDGNQLGYEGWAPRLRLAMGFAF
jgi:hypothetical protein